MKKKKIALITYSLSVGGLERIVANSTFLFDELGYEVHLYVLESRIDYPFNAKLYKFNLEKTSKIRKIPIYLKIKKLLRENNYDIIIDHRYRLNPFIELLWQKWFYKKKNVVNYIHSSKIFNYIFKSNFLNSFLFKKRYFITVSKGIEKMINDKFPSLKTKTIYNFVTIVKSELSLNLPEKFILTIARLEKNNIKQIDVLLECYAKSELPKQNISLVILGNGENEITMHKLANDLGIKDLVLFEGFVAEPYHYLKKAFFTVLTSKYEGLPTVLIESLLSKTPVISFNCPTGPNEIIIDHINGLLIENQNKKELIFAFNKLVYNRKLYTFLRENTINSVEKFKKSEIIKQWKIIISGIH